MGALLLNILSKYSEGDAYLLVSICINAYLYMFWFLDLKDDLVNSFVQHSLR